MGSKKHKKHKRERYDEKQLTTDKPPGLKLILKVGGSSTPEHSSDSPGVQLPSNYSVAPNTGDEESMHSIASLQPGRSEDRQHKKAKKKKKKKEKEKDREKHDKKRKHHHKEKRKRARDESSQDDVSVGEESMQDVPSAKRPMLDVKLPSIQTETSEQALNREPRLCVQLLRQRQDRSPLQRVLDFLQRMLEKRDPQQFFAWPVTDHIAPGYSQIIPVPMDFSTMRQKIDDNAYLGLNEYIEDLKQMCTNAMVYNHPETIYYKAARRLLHGGVKALGADKLRVLEPILPALALVPATQLGFELALPPATTIPAPVPAIFSASPEPLSDVDTAAAPLREPTSPLPMPPPPLRRGPNFLPDSKFEAIPDDLTPEEILDQAQRAAQAAAERLSLKRPNTKMGFLRQQKDGTTSLAILVPSEGIDPDTNERPVSLGQLIGKLAHGSGQLQGFREDRRNISKAVKPLYYGAFGSYAPSYDSTFANLTKEESDLVLQTYGDETAVQYAESILNFAKDCDYTLTMVDSLLDLLTGGDHRRTKRGLEERRRLREEEEKVRQLMEVVPPPPATPPGHAHVIAQLRTLADIGIDTGFLDHYEKAWKEELVMQDRLDQTTVLIEKLQQVQNDRLSAPPPTHLAHVAPPSDSELHLAEKITSSLTEMSKQAPPSAIVSVPAIRKALGVVSVPNTASVGIATEPAPPPPSTPTPQASPMDTQGDEGSSGGEEEGVGVDLESELREFLESDTPLNFPLHDDKTIEEMLSES